MALGKVSDALLTSSAIKAQSKPIIDPRAVRRPIMKLVPVVAQPPLLVTVSKASFALFLGDMTSKGMQMAKTPSTWRINIGISARGKDLARKILMEMAIATAAMTSRVPCHCCGS
ncbi:MAG: hypothetical protein Q9220_002636 [cf. Caloplaca sp. 1 TL-2023]